MREESQGLDFLQFFNMQIIKKYSNINGCLVYTFFFCIHVFNQVRTVIGPQIPLPLILSGVHTLFTLGFFNELIHRPTSTP